MASASLASLESICPTSVYARTRRSPLAALRKCFSTIASNCRNSKTRISRGITLDVSIEEVTKMYNRQRGLCKLSGVPLTGLSGCVDKVSIDRIDSDQPYSLKNIQLVTQQCNLAKQDYTDPDFIRMCINVAIHQGYVKSR